MTISTLASSFDGHAIDIILIGGERYIRGAQAAQSLGYQHPKAAIRDLVKRHRSEFDSDEFIVVELPTPGGRQLTRLFSERGCMKLAMLASTPKAAAFRDWAAQVLTAPRPAPLLLADRRMSASARTELRQAWLKVDKNRKFVKYQKAGLNMAEIALLCGWKNSSTVTRKRRAAEALGLFEPSPQLAVLRQRMLANGLRGRGVIA